MSIYSIMMIRHIQLPLTVSAMMRLEREKQSQKGASPQGIQTLETNLDVVWTQTVISKRGSDAVFLANFLS